MYFDVNMCMKQIWLEKKNIMYYRIHRIIGITRGKYKNLPNRSNFNQGFFNLFLRSTYSSSNLSIYLRKSIHLHNTSTMAADTDISENM